MGSIKLKSSDGQIFEANREMVKLSEFIESMVEHFGEDEFRDKAMTLKGVDSECLGMILKWAACKTDTDFNSDSLVRFEKKFIQENQKNIYQLIDAANFLGVKDLLDMLCKIVASKFTNKMPSQLREEFGITE